MFSNSWVFSEFSKVFFKFLNFVQISFRKKSKNSIFLIWETLPNFKKCSRFSKFIEIICQLPKSVLFPLEFFGHANPFWSTLIFTVIVLRLQTMSLHMYLLVSAYKNRTTLKCFKKGMTWFKSYISTMNFTFLIHKIIVTATIIDLTKTKHTK